MLPWAPEVPLRTLWWSQDQSARTLWSSHFQTCHPTVGSGAQLSVENGTRCGTETQGNGTWSKEFGPPRPRVKGRDAALHSFKAGRMLSVASRLHEILGLGDGGRCRWREELVRKDGRGLCEGRGMEERESQRKVLSPKGKPARSHLCGVQALLPQAAAAQRPQPPRAWPGRVPADTPGSLSSVRQCARSSQHGHRPSAGGRGARK